ncbi:unnamed protein product, partial [Mesorhabditis spiculigera]
MRSGTPLARYASHYEPCNSSYSWKNSNPTNRVQPANKPSTSTAAPKPKPQPPPGYRADRPWEWMTDEELCEACRLPDELEELLLKLCGWGDGEHEGVYERKQAALAAGKTLEEFEEEEKRRVVKPVYELEEEEEWFTSLKKHVDGNKAETRRRTLRTSNMGRDAKRARTTSISELDRFNSFCKLGSNTPTISTGPSCSGSSFGTSSVGYTQSSSQATSGVFSAKMTTDELEYAYMGVVCGDNLVRHSTAKTADTHQEENVIPAPSTSGSSMDDAFACDMDF